MPTLSVDGKTLTENVAIQQWIARSFPAARLLPSDPWQELQAVSVMSWCASGIHPLLGRMNAPAKVSDARGSEQSVKKLATDGLVECFKIADGRDSLRRMYSYRKRVLAIFDELVLKEKHRVRIN